MDSVEAFRRRHRLRQAACLLIALHAASGCRSDASGTAGGAPSALVLDALAPVNADDHYQAQQDIARLGFNSIAAEWKECVAAAGVPASDELGWEIYPPNGGPGSVYPAMAAFQRSGSFITELVKAQELTDAQRLSADECMAKKGRPLLQRFSSAEQVLNPDGGIEREVDALIRRGSWKQPQACFESAGFPADLSGGPGDVIAFMGGQSLPPGERASEPEFTFDAMIDIWNRCTRDFYKPLEAKLRERRVRIVEEKGELLAQVDEELDAARDR